MKGREQDISVKKSDYKENTDNYSRNIANYKQFKSIFITVLTVYLRSFFFHKAIQYVKKNNQRIRRGSQK